MSRVRPRQLASTMLASAALGAVLLGAADPSAPPVITLGFPVTDAPVLVTNEYAYWHPDDPAGVVSSDWEMTSGSLFAIDGHGWTGVPDATSPDATSSVSTGSSVFRLNTRRTDLGDVRVSFLLDLRGLSSTERTPPVDWDGVNVWVRYQDQQELYGVHVNRRDGMTKIERKVPGGPSNDGTYHTIATGAMARTPEAGTWQAIAVEVVDEPDGVRITAWQDGVQVVSGLDDGSTGSPPIRGTGAVGIRGDNAEFLFDAFSITPIDPRDRQRSFAPR